MTSAGYISSISGCGTWTVPGSSLQNSGAYGAGSAAYNLSATGSCTSITVTMNKTITVSGAAGVALSYWQIHKPSGTWTSDIYGCTSNSSGTNFPSGKALTLNNTTSPHVIFQSLIDSGGVASVTYYPWTNNGGSPTAYVGSTYGGNDNFGSDVALLNTLSGSAPIWEYPTASPGATGVCADAYY